MSQIPAEDLDSKKEDSKKEFEEMMIRYPSLKKMMDVENEDGIVESHDGREMQLLRFIKDHADSEAMKDNPSRILEAMDEFAAQHEFLINIGPDKAKIISGLILENKPKVLVELGGYVGYSAILFADQMRAHASENRDVHVWSLEMDPDIATIARDLISTAGLSDYVTVVDGKAADSLRKLKEDGKVERIDFLFLDHDESLYEQDLKVALDELKLLQQNACIVADNVLRPGAPKYREYVQNHSGLRTRSLKGLIIPGEFEDELEISKVL